MRRLIARIHRSMSSELSHKLLAHPLAGLSLWETMLVLIIAAVMLGGRLKGWRFVERARLSAV